MRLLIILFMLFPIIAGAETILFQLPENMKIQDFPINNSKLIKEAKLASSSELKYLKKLCKNANIDPRIIQSDFDQDGIRDFTISSNGNKIVVAAEDDDWDDDGIKNLIDQTIGDFKIPMTKVTTKIIDSYNINSNIDIRKKLLENKITLISTNSTDHEELVLLLLINVLDKVKLSELKIVNATVPKISYGKNVFFSYIGNANVMEFYPEKFHSYIQNLKKTQYKGVSDKVFLNSIIIPIIVHSLAHEVGHSIPISKGEIRSVARKSDWKIDEVLNTSIYSSKHRHPFKNSPKLIIKKSYKDQSYEKFMANYNKYLEDKQNHKLENAYKTGTKSTNSDLKYSFLKGQKIPSLYSALNPSEWFAENFASCIYVKFYPSADTLDGATKTELLIGIRPDVRFKLICEKYL